MIIFFEHKLDILERRVRAVACSKAHFHPHMQIDIVLICAFSFGVLRLLDAKLCVVSTL